MKYLTQMDIAKKANVDRTSVSKILSNYQGGKFSKEVIARVKNIASELGYKSRPMRTSLNICFVFNLPLEDTGLYPSSHRILEAICGITDALRDINGYIHIVNYNSYCQKKSIQGDGALFWEEFPSICKVFKRQKKEFIVLNRVSKGYKGSYIIHDDKLDFQMATNTLLDANHKHIAFVGDGPNISICHRAKKAIRKAMEARGLSFSDRECFYIKNSGKKYDKIIHSLERTGITGIVAVNDLVAWKTIEAIWHAGKNIPEDFSIIGNNFVELPQFHSLKLTSIKTPWYEIATRGTEYLLSKLNNNGKVQSIVHEVLMPQVNKGNTVKKLAKISKR